MAVLRSPSHPSSPLSFPFSLPDPPPLRPVQLEALRLDDDLLNDGVPLVFVQAAIRAMGQVLLESVARTLSSPPSPDSTVTPPHQPSVRRISPPPSPLPQPNFLLDIAFSDCSAKDRLQLPIHGLPWALASPVFAPFSRSQPQAKENSPSVEDPSLTLAVVPLLLPSRLSFPLLHDYIYTASSATLLSRLLEPSPALLPPVEDCTYRLERVRSLWSNVVALEIGDEALWETLRRAWDALVAEAEEAMVREEGAETTRGEAEA